MKNKGFAHLLLVILVSVIIVAGLFFYSWKNGLLILKSNQGIKTPPSEMVINHCNLEPVPGPCKALVYGYYYDKNERVCKKFLWGGCDGVRPFETSEECRQVCGSDPDNYEPWKTYTDTVNRFSVKYPRDWTYREKPVHLEGPKIPGSTIPKYDISFVSYNKVGSLEQTVIRWGTRCVGNCPETGDEGSVKENIDYQMIAPKVEKRILQDNLEYYYVIPQNDDILAIAPIPYDDKYYLVVSINFWPDEEGYELFDQVLSTLTFIGETAEVWDSVCDKENITDIDVKVKEGEATLSHTARGALNIYLTTLDLISMSNMDESSPVLSSEEKVYAEDYIRRRLNTSSVKVDQTVKVSCKLVEEAALKSRLLTISQRQSLQKYSESVSEDVMLQLIRDIIDETTPPGGIKPKIINL